MKALALCILCGWSVLAVDASDIHVVTWSCQIQPENSMATFEAFIRDGQTNLLRETHAKNGVTLFRSQSFYYHGTEVGSYMYEVDNGIHTVVGSAAGAPYYFNVDFDSSRRPLSAAIFATNAVMLDWFSCTNSIFYPLDHSEIQRANDRLPQN